MNKALSVRQPWASLIVNGLKTIEIRTWSTTYCGSLYIHAAKSLDEMGMNRFRLESPPTGVLLGTVELVKVEPFTAQTWEEFSDRHLDNGFFRPGLYAWHMTDARPLPHPLACRGDRSLFPVVVENGVAANQPWR
jgi:hypothetical protein